MPVVTASCSDCVSSFFPENPTMASFFASVAASKYLLLWFLSLNSSFAFQLAPLSFCSVSRIPPGASSLRTSAICPARSGEMNWKPIDSWIASYFLAGLCCLTSVPSSSTQDPPNASVE